jgi:hypothetical protein
MDIRQNTEDPIRVYDDLEFVSKQDVPADTANLPAYSIRGPRNYVVGIEAGTPLAPEFRDANGDPLDPSTQVVLQKADVQGNPIGSAIIFEDSLSGFDYEYMRSDPQYFRYTNKPLLLKEREYLYVYVDIPSGSNSFDATESRLTIGDNTTQTGKPAFIRHIDSMNQQEQQMVKQS